MCRGIDAEQGSQRYRKIDGFSRGSIGSRLEWQTIKREWHVRIVTVRRGMICAIREVNNERSWNSDHVPSAMWRIAVEILGSKIRVGGVAAGQLCSGVIA